MRSSLLAYCIANMLASDRIHPKLLSAVAPSYSVTSSAAEDPNQGMTADEMLQAMEDAKHRIEKRMAKNRRRAEAYRRGLARSKKGGA